MGEYVDAYVGGTTISALVLGRLSALIASLAGSVFTLYGLVVGAFNLHLWHSEELEFVFAIELAKDIGRPALLAWVAHGPADFVAIAKELVGDVGAQEPIHSCDEHGRPLGDSWIGDCGHYT